MAHSAKPSRANHHRGAGDALLITAICVIGITALTWMLQPDGSGRAGDSTTTQLQAANRPRHPSITEADSNSDQTRFPTSIRHPNGPPRVATGGLDSDGNPITVSCSTCHATRPADPDNRTAAELNEFHVGMRFRHGNVSCLSCHNSADYDALKLADGSRIEFSNVMTLCAQCHGPQMQDYQHGAHGGMNGFWDTTRGPRTKNNCIDCHNPHTPQFPRMQPTFKPFDRFLEDEKKAAH